MLKLGLELPTAREIDIQIIVWYQGLGKRLPRVEKRNLWSSGNKQMVRDIKSIIGRHVC